MKLSDLEEYTKITIQCHDNPDADTLASGYGLYCYFKSKGKEVRLIYCGRNQIHKSNLCLMVDKLKLPVKHVLTAPGEVLEVEGLLITVDCQYGASNVTGVRAAEVAVIDHHQIGKGTYRMSVINPHLGSCATLVWKLLREEGFDIDSCEHLGTALYYGLYTDTNQFSELYNPLDLDMREAVHPDKSLITLFRNSNISLQELEIAGLALLRYSYNDDYEFAVIKAHPCDPNVLGLISDFLLQVDAIKTCVVFNEINDGYKFSVRSCIPEVNASELASYLAEGIGSGGGHYEKAGGFIPINLYEEKFSTLHSEGYFNNRMTQYFDSYEPIYAEDYKIDIDTFQQYARRRFPLGYVRLDNLLPVGMEVTIRSMEGDRELTIEKDLYAIIHRKSKIEILHGAQFHAAYQTVEEGYDAARFFEMLDYIPTMKDRRNGLDMLLTDYARGCIPVREDKVYARPLNKEVKVFPAGRNDVYTRGKPGDYLTVNCENEHDIRVVDRDSFSLLFSPLP